MPFCYISWVTVKFLYSCLYLYDITFLSTLINKKRVIEKLYDYCYIPKSKASEKLFHNFYIGTEVIVSALVSKHFELFVANTYRYSVLCFSQSQSVRENEHVS